MKTTRALTLFLALGLLGFVFLALSAPTARAADPVIVRVKLFGATSGTTCGSTWATACGLQYALTTRAVSGDELWVAAGTYKPGAVRTDTFQLKSGVALYGGFAGTETSRSQRNFTANVTILSGDIGTVGNASDNAYHVVTGNGVTTTAVLDGFTVTGGRADGMYPYDSGGGMFNNDGGPTLTNIRFTSNTATYGGGMDNYAGSNPTLTNITFTGNSATYGAGMYNYAGSNPTLTNVTFSSNTASEIGGGMHNEQSTPMLANVTFYSNTASYGGGMYNNASSPTLTNVTFSSNTASTYGGGMRNDSSNPALTNVTFISNTASVYGGGLYNWSSSPTLTNVTFSGNSAGWGGGMHNIRSSSPTLTNVTFNGNTAGYGGGIYNASSSPMLRNVTFSSNTASQIGGGMANYDNSNPTIHNAILWSNTAPRGSQIGNDGTSTASLYDSVVQYGCPAGSTCDDNILTTDPRLGPLGNWGGSTETLPLLHGSSAIDAGDDATCTDFDQRGIPRPQGAHCDIGAYESIWVHLPLVRK